MATASSPSYAAQLSIIAKLLKIPEPTPEYVFHPPRRFKFDFSWVPDKICVEVEGGIFGVGRPCELCKQRRNQSHGSVSGILRDMEKYNLAAIDGWTVLRVLPEELDLENGKAFNLIEAAFKLRKETYK